MDALTLFGLFAVIAMLVCYALELHLGLCGDLRARIALRVSPGRVAVRRRRDNLGCRSAAALALEDLACADVTLGLSELKSHSHNIYYGK